MLLYYSPGACSLAPHIVAREAGVADRTRQGRSSNEDSPKQGDDFLKINPKGSIPALVLDDGTVLTEGAVICQFLADLAPEARLLPATGTFERYRALEWLNFIATELHKGFGPLWRKDTPARDARRSCKTDARQRSSLRSTVILPTRTICSATASASPTPMPSRSCRGRQSWASTWRSGRALAPMSSGSHRGRACAPRWRPRD